MLKRTEAEDAERIAAFESDVDDRRLYGKPLDIEAARAEIESNEF